MRLTVNHRICPGRHFSLRTLYLNIACILSVFDIKVPLCEVGKPELPPGDFVETAFRCELSWWRFPNPLTNTIDLHIDARHLFKCTLKPRSGRGGRAGQEGLHLDRSSGGRETVCRRTSIYVCRRTCIGLTVKTSSSNPDSRANDMSPPPVESARQETPRRFLLM